MDKLPQSFYKWEGSGCFTVPSPNCPINIARDNHSKKPLVMHAHDFVEIAIVAGGEGVYQTPEASFKIHRGDVFIVPIGSFHVYGPPGQLEVSNVLLRSNDVLKRFPELLVEPAMRCFLNLEPHFRSRDHFKNHLSLNEEELEQLMSIWWLMYKENLVRDRNFELVQWALLHCFFIKICRFYDKSAETGENRLYGLAKVLKYIEEHFSKQICSDVLVQMSGCSRKTFTANFLQATGCTPRKYILRYRLDKAREMLRSRQFSAKEVSANCGFCDPSYFGQQYLKRFHRTPSADRCGNAEEKEFK